MMVAVEEMKNIFMQAKKNNNWKDTLKVITMVWPNHVRRMTRYIPKKGLSNSWLSLHCQLVQCYNVLQCWWSKRSPICPQLETPLQSPATPGNPSLGISPGAARSRLSSAFILYCFAFYGGSSLQDCLILYWFGVFGGISDQEERVKQTNKDAHCKSFTIWKFRSFDLVLAV